jgi:hypothetical protein
MKLRMLLRAIAVLGVVILAGCGGQIVTTPDTYPIHTLGLPALRTPQEVTLTNGLTNPAKYQIKNQSVIWEVDARQMTDTAITMLQRALDKQGIRTVPRAGKSVTLRVDVRGGMAMVAPIPAVSASGRLTLEAAFGDGTMALVDGEGASARGVQPAFELAIQSALNRLLFDSRFVEYMNR